MADSAGPGRALRRRPATPPGPRTLRAWRLIGLVLGSAGAALLAAGTVLALLDGEVGRGRTAVLLMVPGLLCAFVATVFLRRMWAEPAYTGTRWAVLGERFAVAFLLVWGLALVVRTAFQVTGAELAEPVRLTAGCVSSAFFLATLVAAFRSPAAPRD